MDYSPTTIQAFLAVAMLVALVGALWPKLVSRTSMADEDFRNRPSRMVGRRAAFPSANSGRHALRVRESYDRMFGRWLHVPAPAPKNVTQSDKAA